MEMATKDNIRDKNLEEVKSEGSNSFMQKVVANSIELARKRLNKPECLIDDKNKGTIQTSNAGPTNSPETPKSKADQNKKKIKQEELESDSLAKALNNANNGIDIDKIKKDIQDKISAIENAVDNATKNEKLEELKAL
jgi:hypothetical protein